MNIEIREQIFEGRPSFGLYRGGRFVAYTLTHEGAERAARAIARAFNTTLPDPSIPVKPLTFEQASAVDRATIGERFNFGLYYDVVRTRKQLG